jgi:hypothetical protein
MTSQRRRVIFRSSAGPQAGGNDVPDAHLVALMRQHGVRLIYTVIGGYAGLTGSRSATRSVEVP